MTRLRPTIVQLPEDLVARADRRAKQEGISRSQLVRDALRSHLGADDRDDIARAYKRAYTKYPLAAEDEWGSLEALHDALAADRADGARSKRRRP